MDLERQRHGQHEGGADQVAGDHRAAAVPSVHEDARERAEEDARDRGHREDDADLEGGAAAGDQRAERDDVDPVADERDQLTGPQQAEVAVREQAQVRRLAPHACRPRLRPRTPRPGSCPPRHTAAPAVPGVAVAGRMIRRRADCQCAPRGRVDSDHRIDDGPEDPERQQHVTDADHVADDRDRQRDHVAEQPAAGDEVADRLLPEEEVERVVGDDGLVEAGGEEGGRPDRHLTGVDEDGGHVGADADRGDLEPRHAPVAPQPDEDQAVGGDEGPADRDVGGDAGLAAQPGQEAQEQRTDEEPRPAQLQVGQPRDASPEQGAHDEREEDGAKKHRPRPGQYAAAPATGARLVGGAGGAWWAARRGGRAAGRGWTDPDRPGSARSPGRTGCR